jgi:two-component system, OmpR family, response regulator
MHHGRILLVEDDAVFSELVSDYLRRENFIVEEAATGAIARRHFETATIDLVLLDVSLPDADGFDLLRDLRSSSGKIPVIMLTAKDTPIDRILGLELGADDYIGKPFELGELRARIRSVLRRTHGIVDMEVESAIEALTFAGCTLDLTYRRLLDSVGREIILTSAEFDLLRALVEHPRRPLSRDQLLNLTRSRNWAPFDRSIDVVIVRLRRKLAAATNDAEIIKTVRNVGYVLAAEVRRRRISGSSLSSPAAKALDEQDSVLS